MDVTSKAVKLFCGSKAVRDVLRDFLCDITCLIGTMQLSGLQIM